MVTSSRVYFIDKTTGTPADAVLAFGLASLMDKLAGDTDIGLRIEDGGDRYDLVLRDPLPENRLSRAAYFFLFPALTTAKKATDLPAMHCVDYRDHQSRNQAYFEARAKGLRDEELRDQGLVPPDSAWPVWAVVNQMSATDAYNGLAVLWHAHRDCFPELLAIIFELYGRRPNDEGAAIYAWQALAKAHGIAAAAEASQPQVVNPGMGKGGNRTKADALTIGGLKGFWVPEYLKFAGLYQCALPRTVRGSKDRKTYVLRPRTLTWRTHRQVFPDFQATFYSQTAVKMDILAALHYCIVFLQQWKDGQVTSRFKFARGQPGDHVAAIEAISYKHLGSAHATMNVSSITLPLWIPTIETVDDADRFLALLIEHEAVVRSLDEARGDAYDLLRDYRTFLSARDLRAFYRFTRRYAGYVMRAMSGAGVYPPRRFAMDNLEVLIMSHNPQLGPIMQNEGFRRIAAAIRQSTVLPQYHKSRGQSGPYEIRYGLGNDLLRDASYPEKFAQALSKFVFAYNHENGQVNERFKGAPPVRRTSVSTGDIEQVLALIDQYQDSETVANLLVAFGYARDPRRSDEPEPDAVAEARGEGEMEEAADA